MKKLHFHWIFISFLTLWVGSCGKLKKETIAKVNNEDIPLSLYKSEYQNFLSKIYQEDNLVNRYAYLNNLIDEKLILKYAAENHLYKDSLFSEIAESIYDQLLLNFLFKENLYAIIMSCMVKLGRICLPPNTVIILFFNAPNVKAFIDTSSLIAGEYPQTVAGLRIVKSIFFL